MQVRMKFDVTSGIQPERQHSHIRHCVVLCWQSSE